MRPGIGPSSFYDPISAGSSRRSSQLSTTTNGGASIPPPPPSHLLAGQLQRLQSSPKPSRNLVLQTQSASLQQTAIQQSLLNANLCVESLRQSTTTNNSTDMRRLSEPCHNLTERKSPPPRPASVTLSPLKGAVSSTELHPNQAVILDEVGEGEMVENKLVIPDEMVHYLNQVADTQNDYVTWSDGQNTTDNQRNLSSPSQIMSPSNNIITSPSNLNDILPSPTNNFSQILSPPQPVVNANVLSPVVNQMIASPSTNLTQMLPSPAPTTINQMASPAPNFNQIASPASNYNQIASPASNFSQMPSPASNFNQMIHSPASNYGGTIPNPLMSPNVNQIMVNQQKQLHTTNTMQNNASQTNQLQTSNPMTPQTNIIHVTNPLPSPSPSQSQTMQHQQCNSLMMQNNQILPNGMNQCYSNQMANGMCYVQQSNWNVMQNQMCQNQMRQSTDHHHNTCHMRNGNVNNPDYSQCNKQMVPMNNYMTQQNNASPQCGGNHHNYHQMCNNAPTNNSYMMCHIKTSNNYKTYSSMQSPSYNNNNHCVPNIIEPLTSPAIATPAPSSNDLVTNQPQQAQMSRPHCNHYEQCYRSYANTNQCTGNTTECNCNCRKINLYPQNKCFNNNQNIHHQCNKSEIQCKDISQSQMSPRLIATPQNNQQPQNSIPTSQIQQQQPQQQQPAPPPSTQQQNSITQLQPIGMRQDAYQRTLEYVQNCQSWVSNDLVSSSTHPLSNKCGNETTSNMVVNDMTSSLSSLLEENRYLQMIQ